MDAFALCAELQSFAGRIADIDAHEFLPAQELIKSFGRETKPLVDYFERFGESEAQNVNTMNVPNFPGDVLPITKDVIHIKGARAPGAVLPERRIEVMNAMGVQHQLLFPTGLGIIGVSLYKSADNPEFMSEIKGNRREIAKRWFCLYNEWLKGVKATSSRIRPAALLFGDTPSELIQMAEDHIREGFRAVLYLSASQLSGGRSPAHPELDPLWARLAEANCVFTLHLEAEGTSLKANGWRDAPAFEGFLNQGEFSADPGFLATVHQSYENFLAIMVLGGVFERHPKLRVGIIEVGAYWIGPMMRRLDLWYKMGDKFRQDDALKSPTFRLSHPPSYYVKRNVRVTPFVFEDVAREIDVYDLGKVLGFSTDYPHVEGGKNAFMSFYKNLEGHGNSVLEDFFVNNGSWLFPT